MFSTPFVLTFSLLLSLPILFFLAPRILPPKPHSLPISPSDELDDITLFNRAITLANSRATTASATNPSKFFHLSSKNPSLKIAFLFLTNTDLHFSPLWDLYFRDTPSNLFNIYIHADPSVNITRPLSPLFADKFIPSKRTFRASPTLISATRRLLATALLDDPANAYFALLSQHCVPLHSFTYTYRSLLLSPTFDSSDPESSRIGIRLKYKSFIEILSHAPKLWKRYTSRGRYAMMPEVPFEQFRVGSQFFALTRRHALLVVKDRTLWRKFKIPCYRDDECYPEEHYFPTLLSMADPDGCTKYTLTKVNWTGTVNGHPYTYRPPEVSSELILRLRQSNNSESYLFARKFTPDCLEPLMRIAKSVIFRD
ncbi:glycosyltransferase BC10 [Vigna unguiculata]|uniref:Glycosyl transferase n=1 Tax=Vigna unguiculata TaxID=3917 RepID=A0A4D6N893_VIGUN|nr:glycosyltransferase BC10 [Vigna unguiculata]XP_027928865.1 glycosyltransferase BC10 [Vigna unguiculata]QCE09518.1 Glycosyl transferase [Vigna unguiculata]